MFTFTDGWDLFWAVALVTAYLTSLIALFAVIADLFNDHRLDPSWKAVWVLFLIFVPFVSLLVYVVVRGPEMNRRRRRRALQVSQASDTYLRNLRLQHSAADEIVKAKSLLDEGILTQEQFERIKAIALAN